MVNKVTFLGFRVAITPIAPPWIRPWQGVMTHLRAFGTHLREWGSNCHPNKFEKALISRQTQWQHSILDFAQVFEETFY